MIDPRDQTINVLRRKLNVALKLMTQYQRDRYEKINQKMNIEAARKNTKRGGRPREFKWYLSKPQEPAERVSDKKA